MSNFNSNSNKENNLEKQDFNESNLKKNFHLPSWFSFQDIFKLSNLENDISYNHNNKNIFSNKYSKNNIYKSKELIRTNNQYKVLDNYEKLIVKENKFPKEIKDELELIFEKFQTTNGNIKPNLIKRELKGVNFHKENPKIYRLIEELEFSLVQNDKEEVSFTEFIEFLEKKLLDFNSRKVLDEHYNIILNETQVDSKEKTNKQGLSSDDLIKLFLSQEIDIDLPTLKNMMKEIFGISTKNDDKVNNNENWDFELSNEDFYYIMTKRPEMVESYFSINNKK
jgi:hypothetical protein